MDTAAESLALHRRANGKVAIRSKVPVTNRKELTLSYTPGVAAVCQEIVRNPQSVYDYTMKGNSVAIVTDGSAVLGLGNIGPAAALPVMEGKAILFKQFADIDAFPFCLNTTDVDEIVSIVTNIAPAFGGVNLEDIAAPRCFEIEEKLQHIGIPVFHDDQHGTAVTLLAALINAAKVADKPLEELKIVISGAGAAGTAIANLLLCIGIDKIICDKKGIVNRDRSDLTGHKKHLAQYTNPNNKKGTLADAMEGADVFIGVSAGNLVSKDMVRSMAEKPIVFAMANPTPEIMPEEAQQAGAFIVGTGRSDYSNQINNVLAFPGIFRGALDVRALRIDNKMKIAAAHALAACVKKPVRENIIPDVFDTQVVPAVAEAVKEAARESVLSRA